jgi:uncharacterized ferritin-like protein (DUF455 family)
MNEMTLYPQLFRALSAGEVERKLALVDETVSAWQAGRLARVPDTEQAELAEPGRPLRPELVAPAELVQRKLGTPEGHAALVHAIAHIEFNAINLALDAAWRFQHMPDAFVSDWLRVAQEEAGHFRLLRGRLRAIGFDYGDFPAHNGLWDAAYRTRHDVLVRMALVPRILEARGLDVTPGIRNRLKEIGDKDSAAVLDIIYRDEIGHVEIGNYWFTSLCDQRGLEPLATFRALLQEHDVNALRGPFNWPARMQAGFTDFERHMLEDFVATRRRPASSLDHLQDNKHA